MYNNALFDICDFMNYVEIRVVLVLRDFFHIPYYFLRHTYVRMYVCM